MEPTAFISVVIPAYNRATRIAACLASVRAQTYPNWEVVVVDDGSQDGTQEVVSQFAREDSRIRLLRQERNLGAQAARNAGIRAAKGQWVAFLDSDDQFFPRSLEARLNLARKEKVSVVHSACNYIDENGQMRPHAVRPIAGWAYRALLKGEGPVFPGILVSKEALRAIKLLDEQIVAFQEWETAIRLAKRYRFGFEAEPTFVWDCRNSDTISKDKVRGGKGYEQVLKKHFAAVLVHVGPGALAHHYHVAASWYEDGGDLKAARRCRRLARFWKLVDPGSIGRKLQKTFAPPARE